MIPVGTLPRHAWQQQSPCDTACSADEPRTAPRWLRAVKWCAFVTVVIVGILTLALAYPLGSRARRLVIRGGARSMLFALGVRVEPVGNVPLRALVVANHQSLLDIVAIASIAPAAFVAKADIFDARPVAVLMRAFGAIPLRRESLHELPARVADVAARLRRGNTVAVFPEGTTYCGAHRGEFRPAFFQAAIDARVDVVPVSLRYSMRLSGPVRGARQSAVAAYVGADTELDTLARVVGARGVAVRVHATETIPALEWAAAGRRALAARAEAAVFADSEFLSAPAERVRAPLAA
ncbi:Phospholipid/glycerol acyltransferase OS=Tsukamurella paurometabola (strain ATCC 8368 / DSM/ CCUG 35730 / CIP 100753 / JCM 10117 / KCTC 9821 / NBRC 16120/ NCIMB 702349 / NCTC 13040) OX=521096 GN=Tpau_2911 PE=4 SV=1 [Tsukamurella paurometabola]|uniref:Phospholipid/glycerol acyltransferase n=1 Tax=Tsukamurella paurometabola (strain ATCC 8368 / DSM 20162 / CCUG 35730 / CIP 100753 / JCM 10117 / KCTC 9821 / NBRC 16120 / NCIMB 702349 / NCTC 13040) TaxID=521096 RepID=D5UU06_TSUPD|nr:lysophospholipid acyltransferase family protein [Tsukamurella paurometabola]ADG79509.1 phospholipid/glycerol acyltransferase [Tsukamurella paurometabola DSM 20162]SUP36025.1 2-acyl-glycerophospho-ethanolamine acyltransferase [Tsukamurella paurometabola]